MAKRYRYLSSYWNEIVIQVLYTFKENTPVTYLFSYPISSRTALEYVCFVVDIHVVTLTLIPLEVIYFAIVTNACTETGSRDKDEFLDLQLDVLQNNHLFIYLS